jgi:alkylation response protein AidB-like acyl-CoA dehydrogenase
MTATCASQPDDLAVRVEAFIREEVIPIEEQHRGVLHDAPESLRSSLQQRAADRGLLAPHAPVECGGLGLTMVQRAPVFERAGYSLFGPLAMNIAAPDEGNVHLLDVLATESQRERFLAPLAAGRVRSCFAMTEPAPGAGSDLSLLNTTATRVGDRWRIDGRKWFITGAIGADFAICMARTSGGPGDRTGATMFLVPMATPGVNVERAVETLDEGMIGGHGELSFEDCWVDGASVLGEVDHGFAHAQIRLGPARLTHCMRWNGLARRAHDIAVSYALDREAFGRSLSEHGLVLGLVADNEIDLSASTSVILSAARTLDAGDLATVETSIAKTFVSESVGRVVDRSLQICGALGVSRDILLSRYYAEVRPFRIYDGPSETHRWAIARRTFRDARRRRDEGGA